MTPPPDEACIIVLTAPSGAGKSTLARALMERLPQLRFSVSATTRAPRAHEQDGADYHFVSREQFDRMINTGAFMEYEEVYPGLLYGTPWSEVQDSRAAAPVVLDVDVNGALRVKKSYGANCLALFIAPPSIEKLRARLSERGSESPESLASRTERWDFEMSYRDSFDAVVVNDDLDAATELAHSLVVEYLDRRTRRASASG